MIATKADGFTWSGAIDALIPVHLSVQEMNSIGALAQAADFYLIQMASPSYAPMHQLEIQVW